ncbi:Tyrosyl-tRNA synthetase mitochondrial [Penicillium paradoxum]|uniref:Tyrosyl-tRNA synthetase mitochondrial n=1 Tax=Penicillium paradoxum TaxID=176176 RepID=UPI00254775C9|nr:Tyrosyl-tRNA synthetase mitochondrial [Penicillium paradoxum]KAJ5788275.1 Tyrosyl-tRNA synthetase mitochondrial [Penicillium paradoxum]
MRPQSASLSRAPCRSLLNRRHIPCGARSFATTTALPLRGDSNRPVLSASQSGTCFQQQRWITQKHIQRMKDGEKEWAGFAQEIKAGTRKNFAQHLEERGLIHDVVGYGAPIST